MPHDALSLLLTGIQSDKHKQIKSQKVLVSTDQQKGKGIEQSSKSEARTVVPSRDPLEVTTKYPHALGVFYG